MKMPSFKQLFFDFCQINRSRREQEIHTNSELSLSGWYAALDSLVSCYQPPGDRQLLTEALSDPYFPFTKLLKLNIEELGREPKLSNLSGSSLGSIAAQHLLEWAQIFQAIRADLRRLNKNRQVCTLSLRGFPQETIPQASSCNNCGCCCEIRGGPPEFTGSAEPPSKWFEYFRGDGAEYQRFCPFLFEHFATGKFFCSIYQIKPRCCWEFDREECNFLQKDVAREKAEAAGG